MNSNTNHLQNTTDAVSLISELDPNLHGMEAVVGTILNNTAVYTALARRYREGGRPGLAEALESFVESHGELLHAIRTEALSDELARSFGEELAPAPVMGEDGYLRAPLPPALELTDAEIADARVSVRMLLDWQPRPVPAPGTMVRFLDGTVGFFRGAKARWEEVLAAREGVYHN